MTRKKKTIEELAVEVDQAILDTIEKHGTLMEAFIGRPLDLDNAAIACKARLDKAAKKNRTKK